MNSSAQSVTPEISVVLCTRNRANYLLQTLAYYDKLIAPFPWELVIVDNGSTDQTAQVLQDFVRQSALPVRVVPEPRPGLSRARNAGWRHARGAVIAFTDDDCYPEPDFLEQILKNFRDSAIGYLGGRILLFDPTDYPITILLHPERIDIPPNSYIQTGVIQGANMSARREVLAAVDGFDDLLGAGTRFPSEDADFISRASYAGFTGAYDPGPAVQHHHRRKTVAQVSALRRTYDIGRGAYYAKCLLDRPRRYLALKHWYWSFLYRMRRVLGDPGQLGALANELGGAIGYVGQRIWLNYFAKKSAR